jgi:hypothetical protein
MNNGFALFTATSIVALLAGCNSTDNGANNGTFVPDSFSALGANATVTVNGTARGISLTNVSGNEESGFSGNAEGPTFGPITASVGLDENRDLASVNIVAPFLVLDQTLNDTNATLTEETVTAFLPAPISLDVTTGTATDDSFSVQLVGGPTDTPFEYQTYGRWVLNTGEGSFDMAVFSAGFETPMSGVPTSGTLDYAGTVDGRVIYPNGPIYETVANFNASVDFGQAQYFTFATTETMRITGSTASIDNRFNLNGGGNLNGTSMIGSIASTTNPDFLPIGTVNAQLYGPAANEIGGTFAVSSRPRQPSNPLTYIGSFGGATVSTD